MKTLVVRNLRLLGDFPALVADLFPPCENVSHLVRDMRTRLSFHAVFHADVQLKIARIQPDAFAGEDVRPGDFAHAEEADVKLAGLLKAIAWDVHLGMIHADDHYDASFRTRRR